MIGAMLVNSIHDLGATVRGRRLSLGLTQAELADRLGMTRQWVSFVERGRTAPSFDALLGVLDALDMELDIAVRDRTKRRTSRIDLDAILDEHRQH